METTLDDPAIADAGDLWVDLFNTATERIDLEQFYVSPSPTGDGQLQPVLASLEAAAGRGVPVRMLADARFAKTYPDTLEALDAIDGIAVRIYDMKPVRGGVQHAKFFRVDDAVWLGSQNFDWRSLEHIHELGVLVREPRAAQDLGAVFEQDWALAGGGPVPPAGEPAPDTDGPEDTVYAGSTVKVEAASPGDPLPPGSTGTCRISVNDRAGRACGCSLSHAVVGYDREAWPVLDQALRDAAARASRCSSWSRTVQERKEARGGKTSPGSTTSRSSSSTGPRLHRLRPDDPLQVHIVDGQRVLGTSNWFRRTTPQVPKRRCGGREHPSPPTSTACRASGRPLRRGGRPQRGLFAKKVK